MCLTAEAKAAREGRADGAMDLPAWDDSDHAPYVMKLVDNAEQKIHGIEAQFDRKDYGLHREFARARSRYQEATEQQDEAQRDYDDAVTQYENDHGRKPVGVRPVNPLTYWAGMILLMVLIEFPLNLSAFKQLRQPIWVTAMMALGMSLVLALLAHLAASWIVHPRSDKTHQNVGLVFLFVVVPLGLLGLSYFREMYIQDAHAKAAQLLGDSSVVMSIHVGLASGLLIFFIVNLILYGAGILWSLREMSPVALALTQLGTAKKRHSAAERKFQLAYQARVKNAYLHHSHAMAARSQCLALMDAYNTANLRARNTGTTQTPARQGRPESFKCVPQIEIPEHLADPTNSLNWT